MRLFVHPVVKKRLKKLNTTRRIVRKLSKTIDRVSKALAGIDHDISISTIIFSEFPKVRIIVEMSLSGDNYQIETDRSDILTKLADALKAMYADRYNPLFHLAVSNNPITLEVLWHTPDVEETNET